MKKLSAVLLAGMMSFTLAACGSGNDAEQAETKTETETAQSESVTEETASEAESQTETEAQTETETQTETESETETETTVETQVETEAETEAQDSGDAAVDVAASDWTDLTISFAGDTIVLNQDFTYANLEEMGYSVSQYSDFDPDYQLEGRTEGPTSQFKKEGFDNNTTVTTYFSNYTEEIKPLSECSISYFSISCQSEDKPELLLPGGLSWDSTIEDAEAALGEPTYVYDSDEYDSHTRQWGINDYTSDKYMTKFEIQWSKGKIIKVTLSY